MSKGIKTIASIALPIVGNIIAPGIGGIIGGAIGGAVGGGGLTGAALGALGGYASAGAVNGIVGNAAGTSLATVTGNAAMQGPTLGSGITGAFTGGGVRALGNTISSVAGSVASDPSKLLLGIGNQLVAQDSADAAKEAAKIQAASADRAIAAQQPYTQLGQNAINQINTIQADPAGYIKTNPLYTTLAADAERRLLAKAATKGKLASGGTAAALQEELLKVGNGLVQGQIGNLQQQAGIGQNSAGATSSLLTQQGNVTAAGVAGQNEAMKGGYQNQLNTLLALQSLNKTPAYQPTQIILR